MIMYHAVCAHTYVHIWTCVYYLECKRLRSGASFTYIQLSACRNGLGCRVTVYKHSHQRKQLNVLSWSLCIDVYTSATRKLLEIMHIINIFIIVLCYSHYINIPRTIYTDTLIAYCMHIICMIPHLVRHFCKDCSVNPSQRWWHPLGIPLVLRCSSKHYRRLLCKTQCSRHIQACAEHAKTHTHNTQTLCRSM